MPTIQPSLFDLEPPPADEQQVEYRHDVLVGVCLHAIVSIYPDPAGSVELAEWSHAQRCGPAS